MCLKQMETIQEDQWNYILHMPVVHIRFGIGKGIHGRSMITLAVLQENQSIGEFGGKECDRV